jgi:hypothetical protein
MKEIAVAGGVILLLIIGYGVTYSVMLDAIDYWAEKGSVWATPHPPLSVWRRRIRVDFYASQRS